MNSGARTDPVWMLPVDRQPDGTWAVDMDPILDGDDMDKLEDWDHLPVVKGECRGKTVDVYAIGDSGYVIASKVDPLPLDAKEADAIAEDPA